MISDKIKPCIVILTYNNADLVTELVNNIIQMNVFEYIVLVDNKSTNDTYYQLNKAFEKSGKIKLLESGFNGGYAFGNNIGGRWVIENTNCDVIFFANPDVIFDKNCVEKIWLELKRGEYSILAPIMLKYDGTVYEENYWDEPTYKTEISNCFYIFRKLNAKNRTKEIKYSKRIMEVFAAPGAFFGISTTDFMEIGLFDEGTFLFCEENIIGKKLQKKSRKVGLMTNINYIHNHSTIINSNVSFLNQYKIRLDSHFYYVKNYCSVKQFQLRILKLLQNFSICELKFIFMVKKFVKK